jgi:hypothetical protein
MANDPTTSAADVPEWAEHAMLILPTLIPERGAERELVDAAFILLREKYGRSSLPNARDVARYAIEAALAAIDGEEARS